MGRKSRKRRGKPAQPAASPGLDKPATSSAGARLIAIRQHLLERFDIYGAALVALAFAGSLLGTDELFYGSGTDIASMEYPLHEYATSWMSRGVLPLWNPYILGGVPFQAGVHGYLYPGWLTGVVLPTGFDIKLGIVLHLMLAAAGAAWLARGRTGSRAAALVAGITFALSAFTVLHLFAGHRVLAATTAYLPWVIGALDRAIEKPRAGHLLRLAVLAGLMLLCGHYQVIYIGLGGTLLFLLLERLLAPATEGAKLVERLRSIGLSAGLWGALLVAGAVLAAVQLLPNVTTMGLSQRSAGDLEFAASFSSAPINTLSYLWPDLFGTKLDLGAGTANPRFLGGWSYWESLGYLGLVPLALIVLGAATLPWRRSAPYLTLIALGALLALGAHTPLFSAYFALAPGSDLFRAAGRFCLLVTLFGSLFAAEALAAWLGDELTARRRLVASLAVVVLALAAIAGGVWLRTLDAAGFAGWLGAFGEQVRVEQATDAIPPVLELARANALSAMIVLPLAAVAIAAGMRRRVANLAAGALLLLLVVDLFQFGGRFVKTAPEERFVWPDKLTALIEEIGPGGRIIPAVELRRPNQAAISGVGVVGGYDIFLDGRYARYLNRAAGRDLDRFLSFVHVRRYGRLIEHLGAELLVTRYPLRKGASRTLRGFADFEPYRRVGDYQVYRNEDATPRAVLTHRIEVIEDELETYERLERAGFDLAEVALLDAEPPGSFGAPAAPTGDRSERAEITVYEPNRVEIAVAAAADAVLVLSDTLHPGWSATVDGDPAPLVRANRVMRAVPVPQGEHVVEMTYLPGGFIAGAMISGIGWVALIGGALVLFRRRRGAG